MCVGSMYLDKRPIEGRPKALYGSLKTEKKDICSHCSSNSFCHQWQPLVPLLVLISILVISIKYYLSCINYRKHWCLGTKSFLINFSGRNIRWVDTELLAGNNIVTSGTTQANSDGCSCLGSATQKMMHTNLSIDSAFDWPAINWDVALLV